MTTSSIALGDDVLQFRKILLDILAKSTPRLFSCLNCSTTYSDADVKDWKICPHCHTSRI